MAILTSIFLAVLAACKAQAAALQIISGAAWTATNTGQHIQAHGAGIIEANGIYYMIGEDKTNGTLFQNVNCYSSSNLVDWKYEGALLSRTDADVQKVASLADPNSLVERPKVVFNERTKKYVMYFHLDIKYEIAEVGIATSDTVCGKYTFHSSFRPDGKQSRDIGLFKDDDGSAYLLTEQREYTDKDKHPPSITHIMPLSDDYLNVKKPVYSFENHAAESPAMLKKDGYYFIFSSGLSGWAPNDNYYSYAPSLAGPWSSWKLFADEGSLTYRSQTTYILPFGDSAIYMGDRWQEHSLGSSTYIWLPLEFKDTEVSMPYRDVWSLDPISKTWSGSKTTVLEPQDAKLSNGAKLVGCDGCSSRSAAGYLGGPERGTVTFSGGLSKCCKKATIVLVYVNGDLTSRFASVTVNGKKQKVEFPPSVDYQQISNVVIYGNFHSGSDNTIVVEGVDGGWAPNIDKILLACAV